MEIFKASKKIKDAAEHNPLTDKFVHSRKSAFERFPLLFTLLATFGVALTLYGVEHLINKVKWLTSNPVISLAVGLLLLILTGTLYKKL